MFVKRNQILIFWALLLSQTGYSQFNRTFNSDINCKLLSYEICTIHGFQKTDVKIGMEFILESATDQNITLNQVWIFLGALSDEKGNKYTQVKSDMEKPTNENLSLSFNMAESTERVRGKWKYKLYHKTKLIFEKEFWVE